MEGHSVRTGWGNLFKEVYLLSLKNDIREQMLHTSNLKVLVDLSVMNMDKKLLSASLLEGTLNMAGRHIVPEF